jgi:hypothetical protein
VYPALTYCDIGAALTWAGCPSPAAQWRPGSARPPGSLRACADCFAFEAGRRCWRSAGQLELQGGLRPDLPEGPLLTCRGGGT